MLRRHYVPKINASSRFGWLGLEVGECGGWPGGEPYLSKSHKRLRQLAVNLNGKSMNDKVGGGCKVFRSQAVRLYMLASLAHLLARCARRAMLEAPGGGLARYITDPLELYTSGSPFSELSCLQLLASKSSPAWGKFGFQNAGCSRALACGAHESAKISQDKANCSAD